MKVLVTGAAGHIGHVVVRWLREQGMEVRGFDRAPEMPIPDVEYLSGDITDVDTVREAVKGCDSVVHLAALRAPMLGTAEEVYHINTTGSFFVYEAAAKAGIKRVVQASSINALGCAWNIGDMDIQYFPIDEDHPTATSDPYSFSKEIDERIADYYWRRDGISGVSFRLPGVYGEDYAGSEAYQTRYKAAMALLDELVTLPQAELETRMEQAREIALDFRARRMMETKNYHEALEGDELAHMYNFERFNFWASMDVRDAAQAFAKALTADYEGHHPLYVNADQNSLKYDSATLIRLFFPGVPFKRPLVGGETMVSNERARDLIGYEPAYHIAGN